jgi:hypothetical protein
LRPTVSPRVIARLDRAIQYSAARIVETNWQYGLLDAPLEAGHDEGGLIASHRDIAQQLAQELPFGR